MACRRSTGVRAPGRLHGLAARVPSMNGALELVTRRPRSQVCGNAVCCRLPGLACLSLLFAPLACCLCMCLWACAHVVSLVQAEHEAEGQSREVEISIVCLVSSSLGPPRSTSSSALSCELRFAN